MDKRHRLVCRDSDATLADTTSKVRLVGFSPQQQILLNDLHKTGSPVVPQYEKVSVNVKVLQLFKTEENITKCRACNMIVFKKKNLSPLSCIKPNQVIN